MPRIVLVLSLGSIQCWIGQVSTICHASVSHLLLPCYLMRWRNGLYLYLSLEDKNIFVTSTQSQFRVIPCQFTKGDPDPKINKAVNVGENNLSNQKHLQYE